MIPALDANGLLPPGVWDCTLAEIAQRFAYNDHRRQLWVGFLAFLEVEYRPHRLPCPVFVAGSFTRHTPLPSDVDVVVDMNHLPGATAMPIGMSWRIRSAAIKRDYHVDIWPRHPEVPTDLAAFFQYVGDKAAAELQLQPKDPKGILRVITP